MVLCDSYYRTISNSSKTYRNQLCALASDRKDSPSSLVFTVSAEYK